MSNSNSKRTKYAQRQEHYARCRREEKLDRRGDCLLSDAQGVYRHQLAAGKSKPGRALVTYTTEVDGVICTITSTQKKASKGGVPLKTPGEGRLQNAHTLEKMYAQDAALRYAEAAKHSDDKVVRRALAAKMTGKVKFVTATTLRKGVTTPFGTPIINPETGCPIQSLQKVSGASRGMDANKGAIKDRFVKNS